ncbi:MULTISPECIES: hypothetical protein [unclassified Sphingomonas]|nr:MULTISPECIES: hypothetical protein [unclassified Sphingomonas]
MADDNATPMTYGDITPPPATTEFEPAAPLKDTGVEFDATGSFETENSATGSKADQARQAFKDYSAKYGAQANDKLRAFADTGKDKASGALDQLSQLLTDAAGQVDDKLGAQYGEYARTAASTVSGFAEQVKGKDVDALIDEARGYIRKSPAVAVGIAAALGFVVARLAQSGLDDNKA